MTGRLWTRKPLPNESSILLYPTDINLPSSPNSLSCKNHFLHFLTGCFLQIRVFPHFQDATVGIPTTHCFFQGNDLQLSVECLCCCSIVAMELGAVQMSSKSLGGVVKSVGFLRTNRPRCWRNGKISSKFDNFHRKC